MLKRYSSLPPHALRLLPLIVIENSNLDCSFVVWQDVSLSGEIIVTREQLAVSLDSIGNILSRLHRFVGIYNIFFRRFRLFIVRLVVLIFFLLRMNTGSDLGGTGPKESMSRQSISLYLHITVGSTYIIVI